MSLLDRAVSFAEQVIAPKWGLERAAARAGQRLLNSGYSFHGASRAKKSMQGWVTEQGGPDRDIVENLDLLRQRSRDLCAGEGLAIGALRTIRTNEVGPGLRLNAQVDAQYLGLSDDQALEWEDRVEREFCLWADSKECDAQRRCNFGELQALARLSWLMSGDVFAMLPIVDRAGDRYGLKVLLLEADRVCDPMPKPLDRDILGGVEVGLLGEPVAYHVVNVHPGDRFANTRAAGRLAQWQRVPAFGDATGRPLVLHLMDLERPGQRRGVPVLAPVIEKLKQLSRYSEAELTAAVVAGMFTAAITSEQPSMPLGQVIPPEQQVAPGDDGSYELGPGALLGLAPGEKLEAVNPGRPNAGFEPFVMAVCRQVAACLGLPYELLIMQFTASYSASRAALLEAWKRFSVGRSMMAAGFCKPVYETWLEEAVARGFIDAPGFFADPLVRAAWCGAEWHGPAQGQLDPTKEVEAAARRVSEGFSTKTRETRELTGGDFWTFHRQRVREQQAQQELAGGAKLELTPSSQEAIARVDEARAAVGLSSIGGEVGQRYVTEHAAKIKAEAAPEIAEVAQAEQGKDPTEEPQAAPAQEQESQDPPENPPGAGEEEQA